MEGVMIDFMCQLGKVWDLVVCSKTSLAGHSINSKQPAIQPALQMSDLPGPALSCVSQASERNLLLCTHTCEHGCIFYWFFSPQNLAQKVKSGQKFKDPGEMSVFYITVGTN